MTILAIALKYLRGRLLASALTAVSVALGVGLVIASMLMARGIRDAFVASATDYNLVVGRQGQSDATRARRRVPDRCRDAEHPVHDLRGSARRSARGRGGAGDGGRRVSGLPLRGDQRRLFRVATVAAQKLFAVGGTFFRDDPPDAPTYEALLGAEAATPDRPADRRSLLRGRGDGRISVHRGRYPESHPQCGRSGDLHVAVELLGDE